MSRCYEDCPIESCSRIIENCPFPQYQSCPPKVENTSKGEKCPESS